ncbi:MAG: AAA family ATPase, partial [Oscillospiraceae bacterium]|nr:AAA family ATPase [Oscillospiraceae bacterium]
MKIIEMTATFGCLNKATLRPGEGFTLVEAPNEKGKSTWCAFLRAMLYGFPARDRDKEGHLAEKNRYQPWSGAAMEGTLVLEWKGRNVTLYRGPKGTTPWGGFAATYTATGETVPGLTGENCGELMLGVSREVFERTAFVHQGEIALTPSADLEKRAAALASSGEEEVSFSQVERRLKDWLNRRKVNVRVGMIPELEGKLSQIKSTVEQQSDLLLRRQEALQEQEALTLRRDELKTKLDALKAQQAQQLSYQRDKAQADYDDLLNRVEQLQKTAQALPDAETLRNAQGDLSYLNTLTANLRQADQEAPNALALARQAEEEAEQDPYFGGKIPPQVAVQSQRDHSEAQRLQKKTSPLWVLLGALLGALPGIVLFFLQSDTISQWLIALELHGRSKQEAWVCIVGLGMYLKWLSIPGALLGLFLAVVIFLLYRHSRKKALTSLLAQYGAQAPDDILTRAADYNKKVETAQELRRTYQAVESDRAKFLAQKDELTAQLLALVHPFAPEVTDTFGVSAAISRALKQGETYRMAENDLKAAQKLLSALP